MSDDIQTVQMTHGEAMEALWRREQVIKKLQQENEKLRAALKPFAVDTRWLNGEYDDYLCSSIWFRLGQYRAAAAALKEIDNGYIIPSPDRTG